MNACELTASITALANVISGKLTVGQLNLLGTVLTQLADTILTIAAQRSLCSSDSDGSNEESGTPRRK